MSSRVVTHVSSWAASRVAWGLAVLSLVGAVLDTLVTATYRPLLSEQAVAVHGWPFVSAAAVGSTAMGALIISRHPRHAIGWLLCLIGVTTSLSLLAEAYSVWVAAEGGPGPRSLGDIAGWLSTFFGGQFSLAALSLIFLIAPDGRLLSRRWRIAAGMALTGLVCCVVALMTIPPTRYDIGDGSGGSSGGPLASVGFSLIGLSLVASVVSLVRRLRRSNGVQRQQLRLIAASAAFGALGLANLLLVTAVNGDVQTWQASVPFFVSYFCLPILFAVAILRYRMYDIEVIINRAVVLAVATLFAGIGYAVLVVGVGEVIGSRSGFWVSLLATALVALAFYPLHGRVVRLANRLAHGARAAPYEALADFSRRLGETPSPQALLPAIAEASARAVSARSASAVLRVPGGETVVSAAWPHGGVESEESPAYRVDVRDQGDVLGGIVVRLPRGRRLHPADEALLHDLADQTALAFRNAATQVQLRDHVAALDRTATSLAESRRRIIEADDAARRRLESAISREVLPHLWPIPDRLRGLRDPASASRRVSELGEVMAETTTALECLRQLTRGIFPTQLSRSGVAAALSSHVARVGLAEVLDIEQRVVGARFPARIEAAVYFCVVELAGAASRVQLSVDADQVVLGVVGVDTDRVDIQAILDRVEAVSGTVATDRDGRLDVTIPVPVADQTREAVETASASASASSG
ncbi:MAG: hypothetical protein QOK15_1227 [Nocardioidaceae bacterium]|nr:hypothetical protein [Nocardioidaceae bacterium]